MTGSSDHQMEEQQPQPRVQSVFLRGDDPKKLTIAGLSFLFVLLLMNQEAWLLELIGKHTEPIGITWRFGAPLAILSVAALMPRRPRLVFMGVIGLVLTAITIGDAGYFRFFGSVVSLVSAGTVNQLWDVRDSVLSVVVLSDFVPLGYFAIFFVAAYWLNHGGLVRAGASPSNAEEPRAEVRPDAFSARWKIAFGLAVLTIAVYTTAWFTPIYEKTHHLRQSHWTTPSEHWGSRYSHSTYAATFGVYNYHLSDLAKKLWTSNGKQELTSSQLLMVNGVVSAHAAWNAIETPFFGLAKGRRVIVIQLESIQHWVADLTVSGMEVMPNLNRLRKSSLSWDYVMDVTSMGRTSDAEYAVMTGLLPDARFREPGLGRRAQAPQYLGHFLQDHGYRTSSFHGYKRSFWNRAYNHPVYGIQDMYFEEVYPPDITHGLGTPDPVVYDYFGGFSMEDGWGLTGPYIRSARYADDCIGDLLAALEEKDLLKDSMIVIYGDHDMGYIGTEKSLPGTGSNMFTPMEDRIPLVIAVPGEEEFIARHGPFHSDATGGLHDLMPTLLHLLGYPTPKGIVGTNLLLPAQIRPPVPLPVGSEGRTFAFRHGISFELLGGRVEPIEADVPVADSAPAFDQAYLDQLVSHALLMDPKVLERAEKLAQSLRSTPGEAVASSASAGNRVAKHSE